MSYYQQQENIQKEKRRIWNMNYKRWFAIDPFFATKNTLCYSYIYKGIPGGWYLQKIK